MSSTSPTVGRGALRFPNPGSELEHILNHFRVIYRAARLREDPAAPFDHFFAIEALVLQNRVSSKGAIGKEALVRGAEADLTRHRTYNQLKMYTELYRMLGLLRSTAKRSEFKTTALADQLCEGGADDFSRWDPLAPLDDQERALVRECLFAICVPNPSTRQIGVTHLRPFRQLLRLMLRLDGVMTRDEMLISLYKIDDDRDDVAVEEAADRVSFVRGDRTRLVSAFDAARGRLGAETVRNYTRFPLGVLKSRYTDWAQPVPRKDLYPPRATQAYMLTERGTEAAVFLENVRDIREPELEPVSITARAAFSNFAFYRTLARAGYDIDSMRDFIDRFRDAAHDAFEALGLDPTTDEIIYSGMQQAPQVVLAAAEELFQEP